MRGSAFVHFLVVAAVLVHVSVAFSISSEFAAADALHYEILSVKPNAVSIARQEIGHSPAQLLKRSVERNAIGSIVGGAFDFFPEWKGSLMIGSELQFSGMVFRLLLFCESNSAFR